MPRLEGKRDGRMLFPSFSLYESEDRMSKPNNACVFVTNKYRALYDIEVVDEERKIWKGKPLPLPIKQKTGPAVMQTAPANSWTFFSRMYHETNDWDQYYVEFEIVDASIAGVKFFLIPIEKILFGYEPPTDGIVLPGQSIV
jgi:hypothetical protein